MIDEDRNTEEEDLGREDLLTVIDRSCSYMICKQDGSNLETKSKRLPSVERGRYQREEELITERPLCTRFEQPRISPTLEIAGNRSADRSSRRDLSSKLTAAGEMNSSEVMFADYCCSS